MIKVFNILSRTFCLFLMIHLLAISVCEDYILKFIDASSIEQILTIEEDTNDNSKNNSFEFDDFNDKYLVNSLNNFGDNYSSHIQENLKTVSFQYLQMTLPQSMSKILIPPPRA